MNLKHIFTYTTNPHDKAESAFFKPEVKALLESATMPDTAQLNRSISTVRTELEFLRDWGVLSPQQLDSILAQLPACGCYQAVLRDC